MMEHEGEEESYRISLNDTVLLYDTLVQGIELPQLVVESHQSQNRAILHLGGVQISR
jgi:hypothetical protein